jgi:hypothetical protein
VSDLIAGKLKGCCYDHAAAGFLPLWDDALLARRCECTAGLHLHRKGAKLIDGEESLVWAELGED